MVVRVAGELDLATAPALREALEGLGPPVVVDCSDLEFTDSSGLNVLVSARRRLGDGLTVRNVAPPLRRVFEVAGLEGLFWPEPEPSR